MTRKNVLIIAKPSDIKHVQAANLHRLTLRPDITFSGIELDNRKFDYIIQSPMGSSKAERGDWAIIFPDGNMYRIPKQLFKLMFDTSYGKKGVGNPCIFMGCDGIYGKIKGEVRCSKCNDLYPFF